METPIRELLASNISRRVDHNDLKNIFEQYGKVEDLSVKYTKRTTAFITFREAAAAKSVLEDKVDFESRTLKIESVAPWHQPDFVEPPAAMSVVAPNATQNYTGNILMLNDDCLLHIFSYMDLIQLQSLDSVCSRFKSGCEYIYSTKYKSLDLRPYYNTLYTSSDIYSILRNTGPFLQTISAPFPISDRLLRLIAKYCINLNSLSLQRIQVPSNLEYIAKMVKKLEKLQLIECHIDVQSLSHLFDATRTPTQESALKELNLSDCKGLTESALVDIIGLRTANLCGFYDLKSEHFIQFVANNKDLRELNIVACVNLRKDCIEAIASHLHQLEKLHISNTYFYMSGNQDFLPLANLQSLRHLEIEFKDSTNLDAFLLKLSENVSLNHLNIADIYMTKDTLKAICEFKELRYLNINTTQLSEVDEPQKLRKIYSLDPHESNRNITKECVLDLVSRCVHLRELDVSGCTGVKDKLLKDLALVVQNRAHVLTLNVGNTRITKNSSRLAETNLGTQLKLNFNNSFESFPGYMSESDNIESEDDAMDYLDYYAQEYDTFDSSPQYVYEDY